MASSDVQVTDNPPAHRYEARVDAEIAGLLTYRSDGDRVELIHTEVYPRWEGHGVGGALAKAALDAIVGSGGSVVPSCEFVAGYIDRHPEYAAHVAASG